MTKPANHDAYIAAAPEQLRSSLNQLRVQISRALPEAEEIIAYNMPGFRVGKTIVAGYAAFTKQCGIYVSPDAISSLADEIAGSGLKPTKTGITFLPTNPIPNELIKKLAKASQKKAHGV